MARAIAVGACVFAVACAGPEHTRAPATPTASSCEGGSVQSDAELVKYAGCSYVAGNLELQGITSLAALGALRTVEGTLRIGRTERLYTLAGLENLRSVSTLELHHNVALINAGALAELAEARRASVTDNPRLSAAYGFLEGLRRAGVEVQLTHNHGLSAEGVTGSGAYSARVSRSAQNGTGAPTER